MLANMVKMALTRAKIVIQLARNALILQLNVQFVLQDILNSQL